MSPFIFLKLMAVHFLGDFMLQNDWMALGKSKHLKPLLVHVSLYSLCFIPFGIKMFMVTFIAHLITDAITSRINSKLWNAGENHWFFVSVGFDQLLHTVQLVLTYYYLNK